MSYMKTKKRAVIELQTLAWLAFVLIMALVILVFVIWKGKATMIELVNNLFEALRFGP